MTDPVEAGLLSDIIEHPGDDTPRLVYADWLDDRDTHDSRLRAKLIRLQCSPSGRSIWVDVDEGGTTVTAEQWEPAFRGEETLRRVLGIPECHKGVKVSRGFVEGITMALGDWLREGPRLARAHPLTWGVDIAGRTPERTVVSDRLVVVWSNWHENATDGPTARFSEASTPRDLPGPIYARLLAKEVYTPHLGLGKVYDGYSLAEPDLAQAALAWARAVECLRCSDTGKPWDRRLPFCVVCDWEKKHALGAAREAGRRMAERHAQQTIDAILGGVG